MKKHSSPQCNELSFGAETSKIIFCLRVLPDVFKIFQLEWEAVFHSSTSTFPKDNPMLGYSIPYPKYLLRSPHFPLPLSPLFNRAARTTRNLPRKSASCATDLVFYFRYIYFQHTNLHIKIKNPISRNPLTQCGNPVARTHVRESWKQPRSQGVSSRPDHALAEPYFLPCSRYFSLFFLVSVDFEISVDFGRLRVLGF